MKIEIDAQGYWTAPDGGKWKLVLVEANDNMQRAMMDEVSVAFHGVADASESMYAAAIKAAPPPPRYDWSKIPEGYNVATTDEDGYQTAFPDNSKIEISDIHNYWYGLGCIHVGESGQCHDWRESLERRP